jgi:hypothetical protein
MAARTRLDSKWQSAYRTVPRGGPALTLTFSFRASAFVMAKLAGKCVFCGASGNLSKGHIWPDWINKILPPTATHHEQYTGAFVTFESTVPGPAKTQKIKQGHARSRKPRNTCIACNGGWMSRIESSSMPCLTALVTAKAFLFDSEDQRKLSALLCLISMRLEFISGMKTTAEADSRFLAREFEPPHHWKIWIAEFSGDDPDSHLSRYCATQLESSPAAIFGADHCNTQVTTLVIVLRAHFLLDCTARLSGV